MTVRLLSFSFALGASAALFGCNGLDRSAGPLTDAGQTSTDSGPGTDAGQPSACGLPMESGPCEAAIPRYAFDPQAGRCVDFVWGGCGGNANNFETYEDCQALCGGPAERVFCGGWNGSTCTADEFCDFRNYGCDWADASGTCEPRPDSCDDVYDPVCGCDGKTYANLCEAQAAGTDSAASGACEHACEDTSRDPIVIGSRNSFGFCASDCVADLSIFESELDVVGACDVVSLEVCDNGSTGNCSDVQGTLTEAGHDQARAVAQALEGETLDAVYGCPDCADGGATLLRLRRQGVLSEHSYEFYNPPEVLERADAFLQAIVNGLRACTANQYVVPDSACQPR